MRTPNCGRRALAKPLAVFLCESAEMYEPPPCSGIGNGRVLSRVAQVVLHPFKSNSPQKFDWCAVPVQSKCILKASRTRATHGGQVPERKRLVRVFENEFFNGTDLPKRKLPFRR